MYPNTYFAGLLSETAGNINFQSLKANVILDLQSPLSFTGRMISTLYDTVTMYTYPPIILRRYSGAFSFFLTLVITQYMSGWSYSFANEGLQKGEDV